MDNSMSMIKKYLEEGMEILRGRGATIFINFLGEAILEVYGHQSQIGGVRGVSWVRVV